MVSTRRKNKLHQFFVYAYIHTTPQIECLAVSINRGIIINVHARFSMHRCVLFCFHLVPRNPEEEHSAIWLIGEVSGGRVYAGRKLSSITVLCSRVTRTYCGEEAGREGARARESGHAMLPSGHVPHILRGASSASFLCASTGNGCQLSATWTSTVVRTGHGCSPVVELVRSASCVVLGK